MENKKNKTSLFELFRVFALVGVSTFGGGYAMLPVLQREISEKRDWASEEELMDYYAIGQCTPGVIAVNTSTFIGNKKAGIPGAIAAGLGIVFPSLIIITIIAAFLKNFASYPVVGHALAGIRVAVFVLILDAVIKLARKSLKDFFCIIIFLAVLAISLFFSISPIWLVLLAGIMGLVFMPINENRLKKSADSQNTKNEKEGQ